MSDYISREEALESVREKLMICDALPDTIAKDASVFTLASMQSALESIPAADVRPVVHGKWVETVEMVKGLQWRLNRCSVCGKIKPCRLFTDDDYLFAYCPNCGADVREES